MNNFVDKLLAWSMFCMSIGLTSHCEVKTQDYIHEAPKEGN